MPVDRVIKFIEFVFYMVVIKGQFRKKFFIPNLQTH